MISSDGGIQRPKAVNIMLHWICEKLQPWSVRTTPAVTLRRYFLSPLADLEDPRGAHPLLSSINGIRQKSDQDCSALYCWFILLFHGWSQILRRNCRSAPKPVWFLSSVWGPVLIPLTLVCKWAGDSQHPTILFLFKKSARGLHGERSFKLLFSSGVKSWLQCYSPQAGKARE